MFCSALCERSSSRSSQSEHIDVEHIDVEHIGMLVTDAELSVALQFDDDEGFRFRPGFLRVRVLPITLGER